MSGLCDALMGETSSAEVCLLKARDMSQRQLESLKVVDQLNGVYEVMTCKWKDAAECFNRAVEASQQIGDLRSYEEVT